MEIGTMKSYTIAENGQSTEPLTWPLLVAHEPRLALLERELLASRPPRGERLWTMYEAAKRRVFAVGRLVRCG